MDRASKAPDLTDSPERNAMEFQDAVRTMGTCRYYRDQTVPDEMLVRAIDAARFAPTGGNRQGVRFVVVKAAEKRRQLAELYLPLWQRYIGPADLANAAAPLRNADHFAHHLADVPALVVVCARVRDLLATDAELDRLSVVGGCSIYLSVQNFLLACREQGLGTAVTTLLCYVEPQVKELLEIPDDFLTAAHIAVGWPQRSFPARLNRRPVEEIAFADTFGAPMQA
jgi:nitroreductase